MPTRGCCQRRRGSKSKNAARHWSFRSLPLPDPCDRDGEAGGAEGCRLPAAQHAGGRRGITRTRLGRWRFVTRASVAGLAAALARVCSSVQPGLTGLARGDCCSNCCILGDGYRRLSVDLLKLSLAGGTAGAGVIAGAGGATCGGSIRAGGATGARGEVGGVGRRWLVNCAVVPDCCFRENCCSADGMGCRSSVGVLPAKAARFAAKRPCSWAVVNCRGHPHSVAR